MHVGAAHSSKLLPSMAPGMQKGEMGRPEDSSRPLTPAAMESEPLCSESQSPRVPPKALSPCCGRASAQGEGAGRGQSADTVAASSRGQAQHAYQLWLSQPSST